MRTLYKRLSLYLIILALLSSGNIFVIEATLRQNAVVYPAVNVSDIELSGLSIQSARETLESSFKTQTEMLVELTLSDNKWILSSADIDLSFDAWGTAQAAYTVPRQGNILERFFALHRIHDIPPGMLINDEKLAFLLTRINNEINVSAKPASIQYSSGKVVIIKGTPGRELDQVASLNAIKQALQAGQSSVELVVRDIQPSIIPDDIKHIDSVISEYRTTYDPANIARTKNIELATDYINGTLLRPNQILSFNAAVGPRTEQGGYQKAPVYVNGTLQADWGGGICQLSSTLYNAALLADLTILERSPHYRPADYVSVGFDATVDFDSQLDLKIKNTLAQSIYISAELQGNELIVRLFGNRSLLKSEIELITMNLVTIDPETVVIQDPNLKSGFRVIDQEGQMGFKVSTARIHKVNGEEVGREFLSEDLYQPVKKIVRVGVKTDELHK